MTRQDFKQISAYLEAFYKMQFDDFALNAWYEVLKDLDASLALLAVRHLSETEPNGFNINPARIRITCGELRAPKMLIGDIWPAVRKVAMIGRYAYDEAKAYIDTLDPVAQKVINGIGFRDICNANPEFLRKEITKIYAEAAGAATKEAALSEATKTKLSDLRRKIAAVSLAPEVGDGYELSEM